MPWDINFVIVVFKLGLILRNVLFLQGWLYQSRTLDMCLHLARSPFMSLHKVLQFFYMGQSNIFFKGTVNFDFIGLQNRRTGRDWKTFLSPHPVCCWAHLSNNQIYSGYFPFVLTWWHYTINIFCDFQFIFQIITWTTGPGKIWYQCI